MKLTILQENFSKSVGLAARFASSRSQLPILGNILLSADKTKLRISSTNLEISISTNSGAKIDETGEISIPAKILSEIVANLPKETIILETDKEQLKIKTSSFKANVMGMNSADFPKIPFKVENNNAVSLPLEKLSLAISKVLFAASTDETRPVLTGVLFIFNKNKLTVVATDGFRLSRKKIEVKSEIDNSVIVPKSVLSEISRMGDQSEEIILGIVEKEKQVVFGLGDSVLSSRLIEGDFPDFEKIIPTKSDFKVFVDKEDMLRAVKLASIFARDVSNIVKLKINEQSILISAESGASGSQETKIEARVEGAISKNFEIAFNFHFIEDFLHSSVGEEICLEFTTPSAAGVLKDTKDPDYLHLIMPVKIQV